MDPDPPSDAPPITVVGGGPAALALAHGLVARGIRPTLVTPGGRGTNDGGHTLCAFVDEVPTAAAVPGLMADVFERTLVQTGRGAVDLCRPYARLAPGALAAALGDQIDVIDARAVAVDAGGARLIAADGRSLPVAVAIDATGHAPALVRRAATRRPTIEQTAYGIFVDGEDDELPPGTALFMDWRSPFAPDDGQDGGPPSFLYALAFADGRLLLEETSLASSPAVPFAVLERRLRARLRRRGTRIRREHSVERVVFPMQAALPLPAQAVTAFGAALGLVQPVTGYSVARTFRAVDVVADTLVAGVRNGDGPREIATAVLARVWTPEARARRRLQLFGLDALCSFDGDAARNFFGAFFAQTAPIWRSFLDGTLPSAELRRAMWHLFAAVPPPVRRHLLRGALSPLAPGVVGDAVASVVVPPDSAPAFGAPR
jgi:lycopene beta-cyclase